RGPRRCRGPFLAPEPAGVRLGDVVRRGGFVVFAPGPEPPPVARSAKRATGPRRSGRAVAGPRPVVAVAKRWPRRSPLPAATRVAERRALPAALPFWRGRRGCRGPFRAPEPAGVRLGDVVRRGGFVAFAPGPELPPVARSAKRAT